MKIAFMGTPEFAGKSLEKLYDGGHDIACVFTQPDRPKSRGMKIAFSPVKELALAHGTPIFQPDTLKDGAAAKILSEMGCDLIAVVAYGKLLTDEILSIPPLGAINIHASLLPKYRGAAPIQWAILNGEEVTGVTSMYMAHELDAGDIILTSETRIGEDETSGELFKRLEDLGAKLLCDTVIAISKGTAPRTPQDHGRATFAPLLSREMSPIDWNDTAHSIKCKVRCLNPWPAATAVLRYTLYKVFSVDISSSAAPHNPGEIISAGKSGIEVACSDGSVIIKELQAPNSKRMAAADHLKGNPF